MGNKFYEFERRNIMEINIKGGSIVLGAIVAAGLAIYNKGKVKGYERIMDCAIDLAKDNEEENDEN